MATVAYAVLLLTVLVLLSRPTSPLTARELPGAALRGVLVLSRLSDRRRERLRGSATPAHDRVPTPC